MCECPNGQMWEFQIDKRAAFPHSHTSPLIGPFTHSRIRTLAHMGHQAVATVATKATAPGVGYVRAISTPTRGTILTHMRADSPLRIFSPRVGCTTAWVVTSTLGG